jgi:hypothetical protein
VLRGKFVGYVALIFEPFPCNCVVQITKILTALLERFNELKDGDGRGVAALASPVHVHHSTQSRHNLLEQASTFKLVSQRLFAPCGSSHGHSHGDYHVHSDPETLQFSALVNLVESSDGQLQQLIGLLGDIGTSLSRQHVVARSESASRGMLFCCHFFNT